MPKVVVNRCFGGFGLSDQAKAKLQCHRDQWGDSHRDTDAHRACPNLVAVVEAMGDHASSGLAKLVVVAVPDDASWYVDEYDGLEIVREGRTWPSAPKGGGKA